MGCCLSLLVGYLSLIPTVCNVLLSQDTGERESRSIGTGLVFEFSNQSERQVALTESIPVLSSYVISNKPCNFSRSVFSSTK